MNMDIRELETADYDILENIKVALYRLWKAKGIVLVITLIGCLASFVYVGIVGIQTNYYAAAAIYSAVYGSYEESEDGVEVMNTYSDLLGSSRVCGRAADYLQEYGITSEQLRGMVNSGKIYLSGASRDSKSYSYKLTMVTISGSSENLVEITNAMARAFTDEINDLLGSSTLQVLDEATRATTMSSRGLTTYFVLFGAVAFILACGVIFVKEFFSSRVYSVAQCELDEEMVLGMIPYKGRQTK